MTNASAVVLAYSAEDQDIAYAIEADLKGWLDCVHLSVDQANEGPVLAELLAQKHRTAGAVLLLVSDTFIRNPNAMLDGIQLMQMGNQLMPVMLEGPSAGSDAPESLIDKQIQIMQYFGYWQNRYLDLRRQAKEFSETAGEDFDRYYRKIRDISSSVNDVLHQMKDDPWRRSLAELRVDSYRQLFIWLEKTDLWKSYATSAPTQVEPKKPESAPPTEELPSAEEVKPAEEQLPTEEVPITEPEPATEPVELEDEAQPSEIALPAAGPEEQPKIVTTNIEIDELTQALTWVQNAWQMVEQGDTDSAVALLETGREAMPDQSDLQYHLALMLATERQDAKGARREIDNLLDKSPNQPDALFLSGELYEASGDHASALDQWETLADFDADYPDLAYRIGNLLFAHYPERQYDAATWLKMAIKADPEAVDARFNYALLCANELEQPKRAIKELRIVTDQQPTNAAAQFQLAELLRDQGELDLARAAYLRARELDGTYATDGNEASFNQSTLVQQAELDTQRAAYESKLAEQQAEYQAKYEALKQQVEELQAELKEDQDNLDKLSLEMMRIAETEKTGEGQIALISGATSGIGKATATRLAEAGYKLILTGRRQERLEELAAELKSEYETESQLLVFDVRERAATREAIEGLPEEWKAIDLLINNAGKAKGLAPIHEGDLDHWDEMIDTNLRGLLYLTRAVSPGMVARKRGFIVNVCSTAGKEVYPKGNVYNASKYAVDALTHAMRLDLVEHGIRVGQICPAHVEETEFALVRFDGDEEKAKIYEDFQPLSSPDVAEAIYFMVSQPGHVNVLDMVLQGKQQASSTVIDRSGRAEANESKDLA
ncbi:MAG: SDR family NAD(P)-dependent oxidoreductase [Bacteroidota bacterium]